MATEITGNPASFPTSFDIASDGNAPAAGPSIQVGFQAVADMAAYLNARRIIGIYAFTDDDKAFTTGSYADGSNTLVTISVTACEGGDRLVCCYIADLAVSEDVGYLRLVAIDTDETSGFNAPVEIPGATKVVTVDAGGQGFRASSVLLGVWSVLSVDGESGIGTTKIQLEGKVTGTQLLLDSSSLVVLHTRGI